MKFRALFLGLVVVALAPRVLAQPVIVSQPQSMTNVMNNNLGIQYEFDIDTDNNPQNDFQWRKNGTNVVGEVGVSYTDAAVKSDNGAIITCKVTDSNTGLSVTSSPAKLTLWNMPTFTRQPTNFTVIQSNTSVFSVQMSNLPPANFIYSWLNENVAMGDGPSGYGSTNFGTSTANLVISNSQDLDTGNYAVSVGFYLNDPIFGNNFYEAVSSNAVLAVIIPPDIVQQPQNDIGEIQGADVIFSVLVDPATTGAGPDPIDLQYPLSYQWRKNGTNITGATTSTYEIFPADTPNEGFYDVTIRNIGGSVTSSPAQLTVIVPESIVYQPTPPSHPVAYSTNNAVVLTVVTAGTAVTYQWYLGNDPIPGATNATYSFYPTSTNQTGIYSVFCANFYGSEFSQDCFVDVRPEISLPTCTFYYTTLVTPANGSRITNGGPVTLLGQANDNTHVSAVFVQQNGGAWNSANITNGGGNAVNWGINQTLVPGTNTFLAQSYDVYSNASTIATTVVYDIVPSTFTLVVNGPGSVSSNWTGGSTLNIGYNYNLAATPSNSFRFVTWSNSYSQGLTFTTNLTFTMQTNLVITATFGETNRPGLAITNPAANSRYTNTVTVTVSGTATDNVAVASVMWRNNSGAWNTAAGTSAWTAISAYAVDAAYNYSPTSSVTFVYVALDKLTVKTNGQGTLNTNYDGQYLYLGQTYAITATAATNSGFLFTNWTGGVGTNNAVLTSNALLSFVMKSNFTVQANFKDAQAPVVAIGSALPAGTVTNFAANMSGTATDNVAVASVYYQLNAAAWTAASGTNNWSATLNFTNGSNTFRVYAVDAAGNRSQTNSVTNSVTLLSPASLTIRFTNGQAQVSFNSLTGATYSLQSKPSASAATWNSLSNFTPGNGGNLTLVDTNPPPRVYRLRATSP
jgi:hypothetical protein